MRQLVGGVGHELAQALLGGGLLVEGHLDLGQHLVQGGAQAADLGAGAPFGDAAGQVARGNGVRRARHLAQGAQAAAHHHQDEEAHGQQDRHARDQLHLAQRGQRVVGGVQRNGGDERALRHRHGDRAVAAVGIAGAPQHDGVGVGAEGAGVAPHPHPVVEVGHLLHRDALGEDRCRVRTGYRTRRAGQDDLAVVVEQLHVEVGGDAPRQVALVDRDAALGGVGQVVEAERFVLGQRIVGLAVEE